MNDLKDYMTLSDAREELYSELGKGTICPCCNQFSKEYNRKLNSGMARTLIHIYKSSESKKGEWLHVKDYLRRKEYLNSHDWTLLKFWGLIEPKIEEREDGSNRNGFYKITINGIDFVNNILKVKSHIRIYNGECLGLSGDLISIKQALNNKFDYEKLMLNED
jgi:hypothetical protein